MEQALILPFIQKSSQVDLELFKSDTTSAEKLFIATSDSIQGVSQKVFLDKKSYKEIKAIFEQTTIYPFGVVGPSNQVLHFLKAIQRSLNSQAIFNPELQLQKEEKASIFLVNLTSKQRHYHALVLVAPDQLYYKQPLQANKLTSILARFLGDLCSSIFLVYDDIIERQFDPSTSPFMSYKNKVGKYTMTKRSLVKMSVKQWELEISSFLAGNLEKLKPTQFKKSNNSQWLQVEQKLLQDQESNKSKLATFYKALWQCIFVDQCERVPKIYLDLKLKESEQNNNVIIELFNLRRMINTHSKKAVEKEINNIKNISQYFWNCSGLIEKIYNRIILQSEYQASQQKIQVKKKKELLNDIIRYLSAVFDGFDGVDGVAIEKFSASANNIVTQLIKLIDYTFTMTVQKVDSLVAQLKIQKHKLSLTTLQIDFSKDINDLGKPFLTGAETSNYGQNLLKEIPRIKGFEEIAHVEIYELKHKRNVRFLWIDVKSQDTTSYLLVDFGGVIKLLKSFTKGSLGKYCKDNNKLYVISVQNGMVYVYKAGEGEKCLNEEKKSSNIKFSRENKIVSYDITTSPREILYYIDEKKQGLHELRLNQTNSKKAYNFKVPSSPKYFKQIQTVRCFTENNFIAFGSKACINIVHTQNMNTVFHTIRLDPNTYIGFRIFADNLNEHLCCVNKDSVIIVTLQNLRAQNILRKQEKDKIKEDVKGNPILDIFHQAFKKFDCYTSKTGEKTVTLHHVLRGGTLKPASVTPYCQKFGLKAYNHTFIEWNLEGPLSPPQTEPIPQQQFLSLLLSRIPIQICTIEDSNIYPLVAGKRQFTAYNKAQSITERSRSLNFGVIEEIMLRQQNLNKPLVVVSIMGAQSTGKSYLMNRVLGSRFSVASSRCTDGVWISFHQTDSLNYVALDCEGLFSTERTPKEEEKLIKVISSVSDFTIMNQSMSMSNRSITELMEDISKNATKNIDNDLDKLYKGELFIVVRDVSRGESDKIEEEFLKNFRNNESKKQNAFIEKLFRGNIRILSLPNYTDSEFGREILQIKDNIEEKVKSQRTMTTAKEFLNKIKIVMTQLLCDDSATFSNQLKQFQMTEVQIAVKELWMKGSQKINNIRVKVRDTEIEVVDRDVELDESDQNKCFQFFDKLFKQKILVSPLNSDVFNQVYRKKNQLIQSFSEQRAEAAEYLLQQLAEKQLKKIDATEVAVFKEKLKYYLNQQKLRMRLCLEQCHQCKLICVDRYGHRSKLEDQQNQLKIQIQMKKQEQIQFRLNSEEETIISNLQEEKLKNEEERARIQQIKQNFTELTVQSLKAKRLRDETVRAQQQTSLCLGKISYAKRKDLVEYLEHVSQKIKAYKQMGYEGDICLPEIVVPLQEDPTVLRQFESLCNSAIEQVRKDAKQSMHVLNRKKQDAQATMVKLTSELQSAINTKDEKSEEYRINQKLEILLSQRIHTKQDQICGLAQQIRADQTLIQQSQQQMNQIILRNEYGVDNEKLTEERKVLLVQLESQINKQQGLKKSRQALKSMDKNILNTIKQLFDSLAKFQFEILSNPESSDLERKLKQHQEKQVLILTALKLKPSATCCSEEFFQKELEALIKKKQNTSQALKSTKKEGIRAEAARQLDFFTQLITNIRSYLEEEEVLSVKKQEAARSRSSLDYTMKIFSQQPLSKYKDCLVNLAKIIGEHQYQDWCMKVRQSKYQQKWKEERLKIFGKRQCVTKNICEILENYSLDRLQYDFKGTIDSKGEDAEAIEKTIIGVYYLIRKIESMQQQRDQQYQKLLAGEQLPSDLTLAELLNSTETLKEYNYKLAQIQDNLEVQGLDEQQQQRLYKKLSYYSEMINHLEQIPQLKELSQFLSILRAQFDSYNQASAAISLLGGRTNYYRTILESKQILSRFKEVLLQKGKQSEPLSHEDKLWRQVDTILKASIPTSTENEETAISKEQKNEDIPESLETLLVNFIYEEHTDEKTRQVVQILKQQVEYNQSQLETVISNRIAEDLKTEIKSRQQQLAKMTQIIEQTNSKLNKLNQSIEGKKKLDMSLQLLRNTAKNCRQKIQKSRRTTGSYQAQLTQLKRHGEQMKEKLQGTLRLLQELESKIASQKIQIEKNRSKLNTLGIAMTRLSDIQKIQIVQSLPAFLAEQNLNSILKDESQKLLKILNEKKSELQAIESSISDLKQKATKFNVTETQNDQNERKNSVFSKKLIQTELKHQKYLETEKEAKSLEQRLEKLTNECLKVCLCSTDHKCSYKCTAGCEDKDCVEPAGHKGTHLCGKKNHRCTEKCTKFQNCPNICSELFEHEQSAPHDCKSQHLCTKICAYCNNQCSFQEFEAHEVHNCSTKKCVYKCILCGDQCTSEMHDHDSKLEIVQITYVTSESQDGVTKYTQQKKLVKPHLCGKNHTCQQICPVSGVCKSSYVERDRTWKNKHSQMQFRFYQQVIERATCNIKIPPGLYQHEGQCTCNAVHKCQARCPDCKGICELRNGHEGLHQSRHRNQEFLVFASESKEQTINTNAGFKHQVGESAAPYTCWEGCQRKGRGHYHLRECPGGTKCAQEKYGVQYARHSQAKYYPKEHLQYDMLLCETYWQSYNFRMPKEDKKDEFALCNYYCAHEDHTDKPMFCAKNAWHPVKGETRLDHTFNCEDIHGGKMFRTAQICFLIDATASMDRHITGCKETITKIIEKTQKNNKGVQIEFSIVGYRDHPQKGIESREKLLEIAKRKIQELEAYINNKGKFVSHSISEIELNQKFIKIYKDLAKIEAEGTIISKEKYFGEIQNFIIKFKYPFVLDIKTSQKFLEGRDLAIAKLQPLLMLKSLITSISDSAGKTKEDPDEQQDGNIEKKQSLVKYLYKRLAEKIVELGEDEKETQLLEVSDFDKYTATLNFLNSLKAQGGEDPPEAVIDGMDRVTSLKWKEGDDVLRYVFHMFDAPPHGEQFGTEYGDAFPGGCPCKLSYQKVIENINKLNVNYVVYPLTEEVNKTVGLFEKYGLKLQVNNNKEPHDITVNTVDMVCSKLNQEDLIGRQ